VNTVVNRLSPVTSLLQQFAHEAAALPARSVAEHRGHLDRGILPHHCPGFGDGALARIELDLDELELLALDLEIDIVGDARRTVMLPWAIRCHLSSPPLPCSSVGRNPVPAASAPAFAGARIYSAACTTGPKSSSACATGAKLRR
jgi:hypothetical protein